MVFLANIKLTDIEIIELALNDSLNDIASSIKTETDDSKKFDLIKFENRYGTVLKKLKKTPSIYSLTEVEINWVCCALNDAIDLLGELEENDDVENYKKKCHLILQQLQ